MHVSCPLAVLNLEPRAQIENGPLKSESRVTRAPDKVDARTPITERENTVFHLSFMDISVTLWSGKLVVLHVKQDETVAHVKDLLFFSLRLDLLRREDCTLVLPGG